MRLRGRWLLVHRAIQTSGALFALVALVTFFLPWHEVWESNFGAALGCAFMPDCHASPSPPLAEVMASPPDLVHTGLAHFGVLPALVLLFLLAARVHSFARPRIWVGLGTAAVGLAALGLLVVLLFDLGHMFDHERTLRAAELHQTATLGLAGAALIDVLIQPFLYVGARIASRSVDRELPGARILPPR